MLGNLNGWHLLILLAVIILLFGAAKLPALAKSVGQSARLFKGEMRAMKDEDHHQSANSLDPADPEGVSLAPSGHGATAPLT